MGWCPEVVGWLGPGVVVICEVVGTLKPLQDGKIIVHKEVMGM